MKNLPESEFEVMKHVWEHGGPVTTSLITEKTIMRKWKIQTVVTLMNRLIERGFLRSEKRGKERLYYPLIEREEYLKFETENFVKLYHGESILSIVHTLYPSKPLPEEERLALLKWIEDRSEET